MDTYEQLMTVTWRKSSYSGPNGGDCVECAPVGDVAWRVSSYSGSTGGECVECAALGDVAWYKSSRSGNTGGDCVEVADLVPRVAVRDSKNPAQGAFTVTPETWGAFVRHVGL